MSRLNSFLKTYGFYIDKKIIKPHEYDFADYKNSDLEKLEHHKSYLKEIENEEENRLNLIESKTSQMISQTGLIFALLSLFIPFIIDKVLDFNFLLKTLFIIFLAIAYLAYILTITNALKNFNVKNFNYVKKSPITILIKQKLDIKSFTKMEIRDSLQAINNNAVINNLKATNLISAYNTFRLGNILTSILVLFLCTSLLFVKPKPSNINLGSPIQIELFNDYIEVLKEQNLLLKEELNRKKQDTTRQSTTGNILYIP